MSALQRLFDRLVGIARYETMLRCKAYQVFGTPELNFTPLERPACWRRPPRIRVRRQT